MNHEEKISPAPRNSAEIFGLTEREQLFSRIGKKRFEQILNDEQTVVHDIHEDANDFGDFLFVTTSRPGDVERAALTFYGLGYHDYRERWITDEWFWYQAYANPELIKQELTKEQALELLKARQESIAPYTTHDTQTERGQFFELLADLTDEDGAVAEIEDLDEAGTWLFAEVVLRIAGSPELLDQETREKLPKLYTNEEQGLDAKALAKFFTPDSNWTWYASEFDGEDIFFGLVSGLRWNWATFRSRNYRKRVGRWACRLSGICISRRRRWGS